jgi:hypothetical protein
MQDARRSYRFPAKRCPGDLRFRGRRVVKVARQENATLILDWAERERANLAVTVGQTSCLAEREMTIRVVFPEPFQPAETFQSNLWQSGEMAIRKLHWPLGSPGLPLLNPSPRLFKPWCAKPRRDAGRERKGVCLLRSAGKWGMTVPLQKPDPRAINPAQ